MLIQGQLQKLSSCENKIKFFKRLQLRQHFIFIIIIQKFPGQDIILINLWISALI